MGLCPPEGVPAEAYGAAAERYETTSHSKNILTIIDFTLPSSVERLWVIDMEANEVLIASHVAHGINSGDGEYATDFSNKPGSLQSSLGAYLTAETYYSQKNGLSLRLDGLDQTNNNARKRLIVVHGADYADPKLIQTDGMIGHSEGCPALPRAVAEKIIELIKGGSVLYIHGKAI